MTRMRIGLAIAADHPAYAGHFPGMPILPGVVLLDEALHAIGAARGMPAGRWRISTVKFLSPVRPGESLALEYEATQHGGIRFDICAGERRVATGALQPAPE